MSERYILKGHDPVPCEDLIEWAMWMERAERRVAYDTVLDARISTVFLGLNHNFNRDATPPLLFETMVFGGACDSWEALYSTWDEAVHGHAEMVERVTERETVARAHRP